MSAIGERAMDTTAPLSADERAVMRLLFNRGHYEETPDDLLWARWDAVRAVEAASAGAASLEAAFFDTGLHGDDEMACLTEDVRLVLASVARGSTEGPQLGQEES